MCIAHVQVNRAENKSSLESGMMTWHVLMSHWGTRNTPPPPLLLPAQGVTPPVVPSRGFSMRPTHALRGGRNLVLLRLHLLLACESLLHALHGLCEDRGLIAQPQCIGPRITTHHTRRRAGPCSNMAYTTSTGVDGWHFKLRSRARERERERERGNEPKRGGGAGTSVSAVSPSPAMALRASWRRHRQLKK